MTKLILSLLLFCSLASHGQDKQFLLNKGNIQLMKVYDSTANANAIAAKLNKSDTAAMLAAYQTAIALRLRISDTASMLAAYQAAINSKISTTDANAAIAALNASIALKLNKTDTAAMLSPYAAAILLRLKISDTAAMLANYSTAINLKLNKSDTAAMLSAYATAIGLKLNKSDTAAMLSAYQSAINAHTASIALKLNKSDTAAMLATYYSAIVANTAAINARVKYTDTTAMLAAYLSAINTNTAAVAARVRYTDTAAMLLAYQTGLNNKAPTNGTNRQKWAVANGNGTTVGASGWTFTAIGTATTVNVATTNRYTINPGVEYLVTTPATNAIAGWRETAAQNFIGSSAGNGGFSFICRFGPATGVSTTTNRSFTGLGSSAAAPTDVEPSSIINQIGVGWDAADANIQFITNDGTASPTNKIDLGIPVPTVDRTSLYEIRIYCAPNSSTIYYTFTDLAQGGSTVSGSTSSDLPAANTLLAAKGWISAGGTSSVIGYGFKSIWVESNF